MRNGRVIRKVRPCGKNACVTEGERGRACSGYGAVRLRWGCRSMNWSRRSAVLNSKEKGQGNRARDIRNRTSDNELAVLFLLLNFFKEQEQLVWHVPF